MEERLWRLSVSIKTKKQTRITEYHPLSVISEPEWSFSIIFFLILVHCCDDQEYMLTLAQGAEEVSMGKPEHVSTGYRQKRKQFCLLASFSRQCMRVWPWNWRLHELLESFCIKQRLQEKISHLFYAWLLFALFNLMKAFTSGYMRKLVLKCFGIFPQNL